MYPQKNPAWRKVVVTRPDIKFWMVTSRGEMIKFIRVFFYLNFRNVEKDQCCIIQQTTPLTGGNVGVECLPKLYGIELLCLFVVSLNFAAPRRKKSTIVREVPHYRSMNLLGLTCLLGICDQMHYDRATSIPERPSHEKACLRHNPYSHLTWWPGVSSRLMWFPLYSNDRTVEVMEMPLCFSISIQSDVALRWLALERTAPAYYVQYR